MPLYNYSFLLGTKTKVEFRTLVIIWFGLFSLNCSTIFVSKYLDENSEDNKKPNDPKINISIGVDNSKEWEVVIEFLLKLYVRVFTSKGEVKPKIVVAILNGFVNFSLSLNPLLVKL